jgi:cytochrome c553
MKRIAILAVALALSAGAQAADIEKGKAKAAQVCAACHGAEGSKPVAPENPILAGQYYDYLVKALQEYKSGKRNNPIMKAFADQLSKKDIEDVSAFFAAQKSNLHFQR